MESLISADNNLALWAFVMLAAAAAILIEQRTKLGAKVPGGGHCLIDCHCSVEFWSCTC